MWILIAILVLVAVVFRAELFGVARVGLGKVGVKI